MNESIACNLTSPNGSLSQCLNNRESTYPFWSVVVMGLLTAVVSIITILGNFMVIMSFVLERSIRQPTNYFIASLALSDLLIGTFSMPLYSAYLLVEKWMLGPWICDLWLSLDWTVCLASQYTVFAITADRFCSVKLPAKYRNWRTDRKVKIILALVWLIPTAVFFTSIVGWQFFVGQRTVNEGECEVAFMHNRLFSLLLTLGYYWITLALMCGLYFGIYRVALELQRKSDAKQRKINKAIATMGDSTKTSSQKLKNKKKKEKVYDSKKVSKSMKNGRLLNNDKTNFVPKTNDDRENDRSTSPCYPSDDENSSQISHHSFNKGSKSINKRKGNNGSGANINQMGDNFDQIVEPPDPENRRTNAENENAFKNIAEFAEENIHAECTETPTLIVPPVDENIPLNMFEITNNDNSDSTLDRANSNVSRGNMYIDMSCFKSFILLKNIKLIDDNDSDEENCQIHNEIETNSPVWKPRESVLCDVHDDSYNSSKFGERNISAEENKMNSISALPMSNTLDISQTNQVVQDTIIIQIHGANIRNEGTFYQRFVNFARRISECFPNFYKRSSFKNRSDKKSKSENRARKALRTITLILGAFVMCWTPYHIFMLVMAYCPKGETCLNGHLYNFSYWLCYLNSPINPFCYAFANAQFKRTFIRILKFDWHRT